jgi:hypothetical protein
MSELDEVKRKIARAEAQLESAEEQGAPFNDPGIIESKRYLIVRGKSALGNCDFRRVDGWRIRLRRTSRFSRQWEC